jgi:hypothetical protein
LAISEKGSGQEEIAGKKDLAGPVTNLGVVRFERQWDAKRGPKNQAIPTLSGRFDMKRLVKICLVPAVMLAAFAFGAPKAEAGFGYGYYRPYYYYNYYPSYYNYYTPYYYNYGYGYGY